MAKIIEKLYFKVMNIFPAIDIIEGKCVRHQNLPRKTIYKNSPLDMAKIYQDLGFQTIHVVDLDATLGKGDNSKILQDIRKNINIQIEVAGGIRSKESIENKIDEGFDIVVIGTFAINNIQDVLCFNNTILNKLSIALDIKDNKIVSHGWKKTENFIKRYNL